MGVYADITHLLDAEREARQRNKCRRSTQQMQAELRMVARYVNEERLTRTSPTQPLAVVTPTQILLRSIIPPPSATGEVAVGRRG